ncbi:DUF1648 domain-containing protein [Litorimonas sp. WD9-15]|uniref:DUF1648 domain-containing protein n=1 Tax=Litorimonas sp. WD9-15 TaxID=3418716 RepID=UPI003CFF585B
MLRTGLKVSVLAIIVMIAISLFAYYQLPAGESFPIHFNAKGEPDGYGTRSDLIIIFIIFILTSVFTFGLLAALPKLMPEDSGLEKSAKAYVAIWIGVAVFMCVILAGVAFTLVEASKGVLTIDPIFRVVTAALAGLMLIMGNYFPKIQPNAGGMFGFNTAWTLKSVTSWTRTHRRMGGLYAIAGIFSLVAAFTLPALWGVAIVVTLLLGVTAYGALYSYQVWKGAEDKID